jgi:NADH:ubiquinone oxidoreductase subunit D
LVSASTIIVAINVGGVHRDLPLKLIDDIWNFCDLIQFDPQETARQVQIGVCRDGRS